MTLVGANGPGPAEVGPADGRTAGGWVGALSHLSACPGRDLNPHAPGGAEGFKTLQTGSD